LEYAHGTFQLRPACGGDFLFAWSLYKDLMRSLTVELLRRWNEEGQKRVVELALAQKGTSVVVIDAFDVGWLQVSESSDFVYLGQLYLAPEIQNRGIGTAIVTELREKAQHARKALTLDVTTDGSAAPLPATGAPQKTAAMASGGGAVPGVSRIARAQI
jgi:GNAT superfamily N-acetyltransferase